MNNIESNLKLNKVYFTRLTFERNDELKKTIELNNDFNVEYYEISKNSNKVSIIYNAKSKDSSLKISAIINGVFELANYEEMDEETIESILKINSIAILFPYLRSQVVLLTSQLGMTPIQLPIINAELLYNESLKK